MYRNANKKSPKLRPVKMAETLPGLSIHLKSRLSFVYTMFSYIPDNKIFLRVFGGYRNKHSKDTVWYHEALRE